MASTASMGPPLGRPVGTQAARLPQFKKISIPHIKKLSVPYDLYSWGNCIQIALLARSLGDLTSNALQRPALNDPNYDNWAKWSRFVSVWLVQNVDTDFTTYFRDNQASLEFADTTYKAIQTLDMGEERSPEVKRPEVKRMTKALLKLWNTRRSNFWSVDKYVDSWRDEVLACQGLTTPFDYLSATKIMLHEVEEEMPVLAMFINLQLQDQYDNEEKMSYEQFNSIVRGIIGAVQKENWRPL
jgi:hypothetical protein